MDSYEPFDIWDCRLEQEAGELYEYDMWDCRIEQEASELHEHDMLDCRIEHEAHEEAERLLWSDDVWDVCGYDGGSDYSERRIRSGEGGRAGRGRPGERGDAVLNAELDGEVVDAVTVVV